jgi:hypothetical protein
VEVGEARADDIGRVAEAAELLTAADTGVAEGFAQLVTPHALAAGAFGSAIH